MERGDAGPAAGGKGVAHGLMQQLAAEIDAFQSQNELLKVENTRLEKLLCGVGADEVTLEVPQALQEGCRGPPPPIASPRPHTNAEPPVPLPELEPGQLLDEGETSAQPAAQNTQVANTTIKATASKKLKRPGSHFFHVEDRKIGSSTSLGDFKKSRNGVGSYAFLNTIEKVVGDPKFDLLVMLLIMGFTTVVACQIQYAGFGIGYSMEVSGYTEPAKEVWPDAFDVLRAMEKGFYVVFAVELAVRVVAERKDFFYIPWNYLDILCVVASLYDWANGSGELGTVMVMRLLRLLRVGRALRLGSDTSKPRESTVPLHFFVKCMYSSLPTLFWGMLILFLIQCIAGMTFNQLLVDFMDDLSIDEVHREPVFEYFGTFTRTILTMFEVHFANWAPVCNVLVRHVGEWAGYVFICYRCFAGFAILSVINAVFVQTTIKVAQNDRDVMINQKKRETARYAKTIRSLFETLDTSHDGQLSWMELNAVVDDPGLKLWMSALEIDAGDLESIFKLVDVDGNMTITPDELVAGASRIKGNAKSIDLMQILSRVTVMDRKLDRMLAASEPLQASAEELMTGQLTPATDEESATVQL